MIADDYDPETEPPLAEMVSRHHLDAVITAGDLSQSALAGIDTLAAPSMGVYGNHCDGTYLATLGVIDLHLNRVEFQGISFVGLQRCVRYKDGSDDILYTQDQYRTLVDSLPPADVLVTHCPPRGINDHADTAHVGIDALRDWMTATAPAMIIHGHTYPQHPITEHHGIRIEYVYGAHVIETPSPR
ncbi:metallophosphoesterase family protein [Mycolicibacterium goodii]|uniref:metallophosphoesterase family protein n=1 Tax=Mycolicibacterium goodii TaxID=134601 RepID=UPI0027E03EE8|nr:metallophosphoesterase [Mycolicibacterium goodii]